MPRNKAYDRDDTLDRQRKPMKTIDASKKMVYKDSMPTFEETSMTDKMPHNDSGNHEDTIDRRTHPRKKASRDSDPSKKLLYNLPEKEMGNLERQETIEGVEISLHQVARDGDVETLKHLLTNGNPDLDAHDEHKLSALHYACRYNHIQIVELLIMYKANVANVGEDDMTPLHFAAGCKRTKHHAEINNEAYLGVGSGYDDGKSVIKYMVENGADVNVENKYGMRPLHFASMRGNEFAASDLLGCAGIDVDCRDKQEMTPLHMACTHGNVTIADMLLVQGANLRLLDHKNSTPVHNASQEGHLNIVQLLLTEGEKKALLVPMLSDKDNKQNTPLQLAVNASSTGIVKLYIQNGANVNTFDKNRNTPLHEAATTGNKDILEMLLSKGACIDAINNNRATPLHRACRFNRYEVVKFLLSNGARIESHDKDNFTPLMIAASSGHSETIKVLLVNDADIAVRDKSDKTAIFWAAEENQPEALRELLSHPKAKTLLHETDRHGNTPLHIASQKGFLEIIRLLLECGAIIDCKNEEEKTPLHLAAKNDRIQTVLALIRSDVTVINDRDEKSNTPLHLGAIEGHVRVVDALIDAGAEVNARNNKEWTPLDCCADGGYTKTAYALLEADSPVDPIDKTKTTPLHLASKNGHLEMVKLLLEWNADVSLKDSNGHNCLDLAIDNGKEAVAVAIIVSDKWEEALMSVSYDPVTYWRVTPMRKLITKMPDVAEQVFNRCLTENKEPRNHPEYCITFDYELLDDVFSHWDDNSPDYKSSVVTKNPFQQNGRLVSSNVEPYTRNAKIVKENHPLYIMVQNKQEKLLGHPLVISLLQHKWASYGRFFYYMSISFYLLFLTFLTGYIITNPPSFYIKNVSDNGTVEWRADGEERWEKNVSFVTNFLFGQIGPYIIMALSLINLLREAIQIYHQKWNYIGWVNGLEWLIYVLAILLALPVSGKYYLDSVMIRESWQWQCGAVGIFLAWFHLIIFMRKFPALGIYVVMFTDILRTFMKFCIVFFLFIVAFALAFYALLMNQQPFHRPEYSLVKTFIMMIGEFEFDAIFHTQTYINYNEDENSEQYFLEATYYGITYAVFVIFALIVSILIMNLLVGLAVDDIKEVQVQARLTRLAMQVDLAMEVQEALPTFIWRRSIIKKRIVYPNKAAGPPIVRAYYEITGQERLAEQAITRALNPPKTKLEELSDQTDELINSVANNSYRLKRMRQQNERMESMLKKILESQKVDWSEEEHEEGVNA